MQKLSKKIISIALILVFVFTFSFSCLAVNVEGSANHGGGGSTQAPGNYGITKNEISGYRFTLVNANNDMAQKTHAIDVLITGTDTFSNAASAYRFMNKQPKTYWIKHINDNFGINSNYLVQSDDNIVYDYGSAQEITYLGIKLSQDPDTILTQIKDSTNLNKILSKLGSTYTYNTLPAGYKVFCEPLFVFMGMAGSNGNYAQCCFTITEIGKYGCYMFGNNSGTESSYNANDFSSIVNYTNGWWPHRLQVSKTVCGWTAASALSEYNTDNGIRPVKHTFYELVSYGYGVAFAYGDPSSVTTISVNPHVSINLQKKANDNSFVDVGAEELLEEGTTYRARYGLKSDNGAAIVYMTDTNSLTGVSTYNNTTITVPSSGNWWYSNEFTIDSSCAGADINYEYLSANFDIGVLITFNSAATATLNNVTTATETTTADNSASATFKYVTLKPEVRNVVENKEGSGSALIAQSIANKKLYSGQKVQIYATYKNISSFNTKMKYSWDFILPKFVVTAPANNTKTQEYVSGTSGNPYLDTNYYVLSGDAIISDKNSRIVFNNNSNSTRNVTLASSSGELTYFTNVGNSRIVNAEDTYVVYPTDLEAVSINYIDVNTGNTLTKLKAGERVKIRYTFRNNTEIPVFCKLTMSHDGSNIDNSDSYYLVVQENSVAVYESSPFVVNCKNNVRVTARSSIRFGDETGTQYEYNTKNNSIEAVIDIESPFIVSEVKSNGEYKRGTTVISSFEITNNSERDYGSGTDTNTYGPLSVKLKIYKDKAKTQPLNYTMNVGVDCKYCFPAGETTLVWFKWTVPENCPDIVYAEVVADDRDSYTSRKYQDKFAGIEEAGDGSYDEFVNEWNDFSESKKADAIYLIKNMIVSTTPDTDFSKSKAFWYASNASIGKTNSLSKTWYRGDINHDGLLSLADYTALSAIIPDSYETCGIPYNVLNVDENGAINSNDLVALNNLLTSLDVLTAKDSFEINTQRNSQSSWSYYSYENGNFIKKSESFEINGTASIIPSGSPSAEWKGSDIWTMKSGYGFKLSLNLNNTVNENCTAAQYAYATFPEFNYETSSNTIYDNNNNRSLYYFTGFDNESGYDLPDIIGGNITSVDGYELGTFATLKNIGANQFGFMDGEKIRDGVHFTPIWYPDGNYRIVCFVDECWTPGGKVSGKIVSNAITISGNMYDDYTVSRSKKSGKLTDESDYVLGDITGNGTFDGQDITRLKNILKGTNTKPVNYAAVDVNGDGVLNVLDYDVLYEASYHDKGIDVKMHYNTFTHIAGDVSGDNKVDDDDATILFQYISDWDVEINENAADVNGDGKITGQDYALLQRYLRINEYGISHTPYNTEVLLW